jgi:hypothetical protein
VEVKERLIKGLVKVKEGLGELLVLPGPGVNHTDQTGENLPERLETAR